MGRLDRSEVAEDRFAGVLHEAIGAFESARIDYVLIGGVASAALGRPRWTNDIDVLVAPVAADRALEALGAAGFDTERTDENWIYKAVKDDVLVDLLFKASGDVYLDEAMLHHAVSTTFLDIDVRVASAEDLIVVKAIAHDEASSRHWNDALGIIASCEIDWDYLVTRAQRGARRVLSLLVYAQSNDLVVPSKAIAQLFSEIYDERSDGDATTRAGTVSGPAHP